MRTILLVSLLLLDSPVFAAEGVQEINQTCATATGGCFAGDAAGFPVTISQPGAYRLTGNLALPANTRAIDITANAVVLDLGGFAVIGPNVCTGLPVSGCTTTGGVSGIRAGQEGQFGVTVRNGSITGMGGRGLEMFVVSNTSYSMRAEDLIVDGNGDTGIEIAGISRVERCGVSRNFGSGISTGVESLVENNDVFANRVHGLDMTFGGSAIKNRIRFNGGYGIDMSFEILATTFIREDILSFNQSGRWPIGSLIRSTNDNLCDGTLC
jgi:hypothetical protein